MLKTMMMMMLVVVLLLLVVVVMVIQQVRSQFQQGILWTQRFKSVTHTIQISICFPKPSFSNAASLYTLI
jgi:regulator of protease activity HflC (stomatin/prohibitin superfamily)